MESGSNFTNCGKHSRGGQQYIKQLISLSGIYRKKSHIALRGFDFDSETAPRFCLNSQLFPSSDPITSSLSVVTKCTLRPRAACLHHHHQANVLRTSHSTRQCDVILCSSQLQQLRTCTCQPLPSSCLIHAAPSANIKFK